MSDNTFICPSQAWHPYILWSSIFGWMWILWSGNRTYFRSWEEKYTICCEDSVLGSKLQCYGYIWPGSGWQKVTRVYLRWKRIGLKSNHPEVESLWPYPQSDNINDNDGSNLLEHIARTVERPWASLVVSVFIVDNHLTPVFLDKLDLLFCL